MSDDRVIMQNPNTGRTDGSIAASMYLPVRAAILAAVGDEPGVRLSDLADAVEARTPAELWANASVGWYTMSVKLHLEATGLLERSGSPQQLTLTDAGTAQLGEIRADREAE